jgi:HSP20 family protein
MAQKQELITKEAQRAMAARSPFEEMERMMNQMFEGFFPRGWRQPTGFFGPEMRAGEARLPNVDVIERDEEVLVRAELPGVEKKDIDVSVTDSSLTISTTPRVEEEEGEYYCCEIGAAPFTRTVRLPVEVDSDKAKASFRDGLLELRLPKTEHARRRAISVD